MKLTALGKKHICCLQIYSLIQFIISIQDFLLGINEKGTSVSPTGAFLIVFTQLFLTASTGKVALVIW